MSTKSQFATKTFDWVTVSLYGGLVLIGWMMLYAAIYKGEGDTNFFDLSTPLGTQSIWIIISLVAFFLILNVDWKIWNGLAYPLYGISIAMLIGVLIFGSEIKGAQSWFRIGSFSFQPSEFAKLTTILALASYLSYYKCDLRQTRSIIIVLGFIAIPFLLILLQPDLGSASVFLSFGILLYREGLSPSYYYIAFSVFLAFVLTIVFHPIFTILFFISLVALVYVFQLFRKTTPFVVFGAILLFNLLTYYFFQRNSYFDDKSWDISHLLLVFDVIAILAASYYLWSKRQRQIVTILLPSLFLISLLAFGSNFLVNNVLKPHQQDRINVWLKPGECDPRGPLYNVIQSKTAIGSGGFVGKGYLNGTMTELGHVPEQTTDFIFSIVGEEQGFIGVFSIIVLFGLLIYRIIVIGERARSAFIRRYAYGFAGILFLHYFINIGMTMGITPVIGIPLPFLSKGGTALLFFSIMMGILVRMDYSRLKV